jgi:hypothetical protein
LEKEGAEAMADAYKSAQYAIKEYQKYRYPLTHVTIGYLISKLPAVGRHNEDIRLGSLLLTLNIYGKKTEETLEQTDKEMLDKCKHLKNNTNITKEEEKMRKHCRVYYSMRSLDTHLTLPLGTDKNEALRSFLKGWAATNNKLQVISGTVLLWTTSNSPLSAKTLTQLFDSVKIDLSTNQ